MEHCAEHDERTGCIARAKINSDTALSWCRELQSDMKTRLPTWVFSTAIVINGLLIAGIFTVLLMVNEKVDTITMNQAKFFAIEEYRKGAK